MNSWRMEKKEGVFSFIERKKWDLFFSSLIVRFFLSLDKVLNVSFVG